MKLLTRKLCFEEYKSLKAERLFEESLAGYDKAYQKRAMEALGEYSLRWGFIDKVYIFGKPCDNTGVIEAFFVFEGKLKAFEAVLFKKTLFLELCPFSQIYARLGSGIRELVTVSEDTKKKNRWHTYLGFTNCKSMILEGKKVNEWRRTMWE